MGTDEHGIKIIRNFQQNAFKYDDVNDFVNDISLSYQQQFRALDISVDKIDGGRFLRTTEPMHHDTAKYFWKRISNNITKGMVQ